MPPQVRPVSPLAAQLPEPERLVNTPLLVPKPRPVPVAPGGIQLAEYSTMAPVQYIPEAPPVYRGSVAATRGRMHMAPPRPTTPADRAAVAAAIAREHAGTAEQPRRRKRRQP